MENEKILNENLPISDEEIEEVSGGAGTIGNICCQSCKKTVAKLSVVSYQGRIICKDCYAKITNK